MKVQRQKAVALRPSIGDCIMALWPSDGQFYEAIVEKLNKSNLMFEVNLIANMLFHFRVCFSLLQGRWIEEAIEILSVSGDVFPEYKLHMKMVL
jgi:hypothetical protein